MLGNGSTQHRVCADLLGDRGCETLTASLHRCLLCHLCDEALDREPLRALLTRRMDWAENVRKEMRDAAAEDKGRIKASWPPDACADTTSQHLDIDFMLFSCPCF